MICNAEDLSPDQMAPVEHLLGRRVHAGEAISVRTFEPVSVSHERRLEIAEELRKYYAEVDASRSPSRKKKPTRLSLRRCEAFGPAIVPIGENSP